LKLSAGSEVVIAPQRTDQSKRVVARVSCKFGMRALPPTEKTRLRVMKFRTSCTFIELLGPAARSAQARDK